MKNLLIILATVTCFIGNHALAKNDQRPTETINKEFNQTFDKMMDDPSDIKITMQYANLAIEMKDYEAAIPALERILLFNPSLTDIKNKLGLMYYKLSSMDMARSYFEKARDSKNASPDVKQFSLKYLKKIDG